MNKKELLDKINNWLGSIKEVIINNNCRIVFKDEEIPFIFGGRNGVFNPFDDYTYTYFYYFIMDLKKHLEKYADDEDINIILEDFQDEMLGWVHNKIEGGEYDLIRWLGHNPTHLKYADKVLKQGIFEDTISLLQQAQELMIARIYDKALNKLINYIQKRETIMG